MIQISETWLKEMLYTHYLQIVVAFLTGIITGVCIIWLGKLSHKYLDYKLMTNKIKGGGG